jgi:hypothetical protein
MSEENKDGKAAEPNDWAKHWKPKDFPSPSPFAEAVVPSDEQLDTAINQSLESPEVDAALANVAAEAEDDAQLDAALNEMLTTPEVNAMLENVAADAIEDTKNDPAKGKPFDPTSTFSGWSSPDITGPVSYVTVREFDEFKARITAAFKHAGFKF